jgi:error-prone DNA polymerase
MSSVGYVELHARSAFSFLRGATLPGPLVEAAAGLGLPALAICDRMGVYGAPKLQAAATAAGLRPIYGAELAMEDGSVLPVLVENRTGYQNLCQLLTAAHLRSAKGQAVIRWEELPAFAGGLVALTGDREGPLWRAITGGSDSPLADPVRVVSRLVDVFGSAGVFVELQRHRVRGEERCLRALVDLARDRRLPLLATNGVDHAAPDGRQVADVFTCLRHHTTLDDAGTLLSINAERHLKSATEMRALFADLPEAVEETVRLGERLRFELRDLGYEFPRYPLEPGETMEGLLEALAWRGARGRYLGGVPAKVSALLRKELSLIGRLGFAGYFLIVADLVRFCRENDILAQGRGSAANSAVCFCLGVTAVDPVRFNVLFERFLSEGRKGWPDIDIDLPSGDRRERVIQEVYRRYGPHGAAMTGTVITYRGRSVARELGKVLGLPVDVLDRFSNQYASGDFPHTLELLTQMEQAGLPGSHPRANAFAALYSRMSGLPRHLGQHSGGMIICQGSLHRFIPLENAAMPGRVVAQWDKDDCADLGIIKVDLLGLGMMAALQECVTLTAERGHPVDLAALPQDDAATFELMQRAETIGVFQVESRAQMATLPRMKPRCFYDVVIEVAIIRPGPIQGDLAHPYLRRRTGEEKVTYYSPELVPVLERTLGIPLFQEQMLEMAMTMARFTGDEAEDLRRAMSFHRSDERMRHAQGRLREAMQRAGVAADVGEKIVQAVGSFALYGFPESHAISFAHLAYASAYLKVHRPQEFYCALLNNQPMGFYSPATLVKDARRRGVRIRPVSVQNSHWECRIEPDGSLCLGFAQVQRMRRGPVESLLSARAARPLVSVADLKERTTFTRDELRSLAEIGALNGLASDRRSALWETERMAPSGLWQGTGEPTAQTAVESPLAPMTAFERVAADYSVLRLTTGPHPMALIRDQLPDVWTAEDLKQVRHGQRIRVGGQVICRQRPGTARGVVFLSLEDETGISNVIIAGPLFEKERLQITQEPFLIVEGIAQVRQGTIHLKAERFERLSCPEAAMNLSHDFH